jgi:hypothetical protein
MKTMLVGVLVVAVAAPTVAFGDEALLVPGSSVPIAAETKERVRLTINLQSPAMHAIIAREAARMTQGAPAAPLNDSRRWVTRHPVLTGILVGVGIGIPLDLACGGECGAGNTLLGLGVGAWGGAIAMARPKPAIKLSSTPPDAADVARVVTALGVGERVRVDAGAGRIDGTIQLIGADQFLLVPDAPQAPVEIPFSSVRLLQKKVGAGAKIGIIAGAVAIGLTVAAAVSLPQE